MSVDVNFRRIGVIDAERSKTQESQRLWSPSRRGICIDLVRLTRV